MQQVECGRGALDVTYAQRRHVPGPEWCEAERKIDELFESVSDAELIDIVKDIQKLTDCLDALGRNSEGAAVPSPYSSSSPTSRR